MEVAKALEVKEGPGDVQVGCFHCKGFTLHLGGWSVLISFYTFYIKLLEVPDAVYQRISTESENNGSWILNLTISNFAMSYCFSFYFLSSCVFYVNIWIPFSLQLCSSSSDKHLEGWAGGTGVLFRSDVFALPLQVAEDRLVSKQARWSFGGVRRRWRGTVRDFSMDGISASDSCKSISWI